MYNQKLRMMDLQELFQMINKTLTADEEEHNGR